MNHQTIEPLRPALEKLAEREHDENSRHHNVLQHLALLKGELEAAIAAGIRTGVFVMDSRIITALEDQSVKARGIFQEVARSHGRPYLRAEVFLNLNRVVLKVPNTKRLQPIVAPLLLVANRFEHKNRYAVTFLGPGVWLNEEPGTWEFVFVGTNHREVFDAWLERCHTDPVNRIILKL